MRTVWAHRPTRHGAQASYRQRATQRTRPEASPSVPARPTRVQSCSKTPHKSCRTKSVWPQGHSGPCTHAHACMHAAAAGWKHTARGWDHRSAGRAANQALHRPPGVLISGRLYRGATLPAATERCASCTAAHQLHAAARRSPRGTDQHRGHEPLHAPRTEEQVMARPQGRARSRRSPQNTGALLPAGSLAAA